MIPKYKKIVDHHPRSHFYSPGKKSGGRLSLKTVGRSDGTEVGAPDGKREGEIGVADGNEIGMPEGALEEIAIGRLDG
jgi:hypothetical protein